MTIYAGSRYRQSTILRVRGRDGKYRPTVMPPVTGGGGASYRSYTARQGDRFTLLANRLWGDPELWWRIASMNPEVFYPEEIPAGTVLRLPY